jgi:putative ABC transport system permease protein
MHFPPAELDDTLWTPIPHGPMDADLTQRRHHWLNVTGRLAPGVPVAQAQAELDTIQARLARQYPGVEEGRAIRVKGLKDELLGDVRARLLLLLAAVAFVLLIGCANVANLLLARTTVRRQEMAVRKALGASRGRLVRQLLVESGLLGILGGALGLVIAVWGLDLLVTLMPANLPHPRAISVDGRVLAFTTLVALVTGLAFGIVPALAGSNVHQAVRQSIRTASHGRAPARAVLLVGEIALTFVLLIGAGLSLRSFTRVGRVDPGFQAGGVLSASITLPGTRYRDRAARRTFYRQLLPRLRDLPGAECAAVASPLPYSDTTYNVSLGFTDRPTPPPGRRPDAPVTFVSPDYFRLMGIPLVRGRLFDATDEVDDAPAVAIISESLARQHWPGGDPLGKQLVAGGRPRTITGVVADIKTSLDHPGRAELYTPFAQAAESYLVALVRAPDPSALAEPLRAAVRDLDRGQPLGEIKTMKQRLHESLQQRRLSALLLGSFAGLALLLAMIGVYGVMSYAVTQRTRELGIRMALGAPGSEVVAMLLRHSLGLAALGLVAGLVPAFVLTRVMASQLYGISATDPTTCLGLAAALLGAATLASLLPALRAARLDPMLALRQE